VALFLSTLTQQLPAFPSQVLQGRITKLERIFEDEADHAASNSAYVLPYMDVHDPSILLPLPSRPTKPPTSTTQKEPQSSDPAELPES